MNTRTNLPRWIGPAAMLVVVCFIASTPAGLAGAPSPSLPPLGPAEPVRPIALRVVPPADDEAIAPPLENLLEAIRLVESGGNDWAVGDRGASRGPYQITRDYWRDATRFAGADWDYYSGAYSRPHSRRVLVWYWQAHCPAALDAFCGTGDLTAAETLARIHNGGPTGPSKPATARYWRRVQAQMR